MNEKLRVFVIDNDPFVLSAIGRVLRERGFPVEVFTSPSPFLHRPRYDGRACLLIDATPPAQDEVSVKRQLTSGGVAHPMLFFNWRPRTSDGHAPTRANDVVVEPPDERKLVRMLERVSELV